VSEETKGQQSIRIEAMAEEQMTRGEGGDVSQVIP
jgi:hypothetical protein